MVNLIMKHFVKTILLRDLQIDHKSGLFFLMFENN